MIVIFALNDHCEVVNYLWRGQLIQRHQADHEIDCEFLSHPPALCRLTPISRTVQRMWP